MRTNIDHYRMAAFDMDGTLLDRHHQIAPSVQAAFHEAAERGKILALNTGRNYVELREYLKALPDVRYVNSISGAMVLDLQTGEMIHEAVFSVETVRQILNLTSDEDVNVQLLTRQSYVERLFIPRMNLYGMGTYRTQFEVNATPVEDLRTFYAAAPFPVNKINIYHRNAESREETRYRILNAGIPMTMADAETTSLECSPQGVDKAAGLRALAEYLGVAMRHVIVVGDADNDRAALLAAGLPVAMANATPEIKSICKAEVSDCDHDGCAEVIRRYLLGI